LGGPVADVLKLIGEVVGVERAPIIFEGDKGKGMLKICQAVDAVTEPYVRPHTGEPTMLYNGVFSDIGGGPMYPGKAPTYKLNNAALGINLDLSGKSVIQGRFFFESQGAPAAIENMVIDSIEGDDLGGLTQIRRQKIKEPPTNWRLL